MNLPTVIPGRRQRVRAKRASNWQSERQYGKRDFDKAVFNLPIPKFDLAVKLHNDLVDCARRAVVVAGSLPVPSQGHFTAFRKTIRGALIEAGIAKKIDGLVATLLGPK